MILFSALLLLLLLLLTGEPCCCQGEDGASATFDGDIRVFAVATNAVYVATNERLYQLSPDLTPVQSLGLRGVLMPVAPGTQERRFVRVADTARWNATFRINALLPHEKEGVVIVCGVTSNICGYCEVLELMDISKLRHNESFQVGSLEWERGPAAGVTSVSGLVHVQDTPTGNHTYILTAIRQVKCSQNSCVMAKTINLQDAKDNQVGQGIFSFVDNRGTPFIRSEAVEFVDAFQLGSIIYLLSNVPTEDGGNRVRLLWLDGRSSKTQTLRSLRGAALAVSAGKSGKLVASAAVPGAAPVLWGGVFRVDASRRNTVLLMFDISRDLSGEMDQDPDFCSACPSTDTNIPGSIKKKVKTLMPKAVLHRQDNMTAVLAVRHKAWVVFFIGTGNGQLIKLAVDKDYRTTCPILLYRANDDRRVFPQILLDQVGQKHLYVPLRNQMHRVPVAKCDTYTDVRKCWSAQDPHCVWCGSQKRCTFEDACEDSDWVSIPDDAQEKMVSYRAEQEEASGRITLTIQTHLTAGLEALSNFACHFSGVPCDRSGPPPKFPRCTCTLADSIPPTDGLTVGVRIRLGGTQLLERLSLTNCSDIRGAPSSVLCQRCIRAGCGWSGNTCAWANRGVTNESVCQVSGRNFSRPTITDITPSVVSFYGKNHAVLSGHNLSDVIGVRMQAHANCAPWESPVLKNTGESLTFHILSTEGKGVVDACALLPDGSCHGHAEVSYQSSPSCANIEPSSTWASGKRKITITGSHLDFVDGITHSHSSQEVEIHASSNNQTLTFDTLAAGGAPRTFTTVVSLKVANKTLPCAKSITYYADPAFTSFKPIRSGNVVQITIEKKADNLQLTTEELLAWGVEGGKRYPCIMTDKETHSEIELFTCEMNDTLSENCQELLLMYGDQTVTLIRKSSLFFLWMLLVLLLIPCIIVMVVLIYRSKQKKLAEEMNRLMENLELDIRNDIRQGFVDLQTEKAELMENVGTIPFLDYKHFASRIFFPESEDLQTLCIKDISQDAVKVQLDECCHSLSRLIHDQLFLTSMVHALEEQKTFTVKEKCALASLLTVALHSDLLYLTQTMELLLKDLMRQSSNTQPKLLLRRTESIVERLLTNWMSICLYGFLRESVGQHLYLMVSALMQQITKGPVDCVTQKAMYTLSEDRLLWQAQNFSSLKLKVLFATGCAGDFSEPLEVTCLTCDTVDQVTEKILSTFKAKFGFPYNTALRDIYIECEKGGCFIPLEEVDGSSEVIGDVTMLNTMKHYKVPDGATIKVLSKKNRPPLSPQGSVKDDENFSGKYFHLIDPEVEVDEDQRRNPERKKLKLKEVHLTKLLSTKVAVHSFVENLFGSIWGMPQSRAPQAVKYFFDFLDAQADDMKIADPEVLHIWKTNSLPLRFWVNILKNPWFVFDIEKSQLLDGCLSVIAQAFMDSFSLSEIQLGKNSPTNKLLYAKDIPKFKQEVKAYYKQVRDQPPMTDSEFEAFLLEESKKHDGEFNEGTALRELYKFIQKYFTEIKAKLNQDGAPHEVMEQLDHVKNLFDGLKSCTWS